MSQDGSLSEPRYGTCARCRCSIINKGKGGWYHVGERDLRDNVPGHFAEPMSIMDRDR